jgi:hypothetical protein
MGYVVQNIHGVIAVNDEATLNEPKEIRFIDPHYNERFKIKDGEQILISYPDGEKKALTCKFIDEYHVIVGHTPYHICQFAECMQNLGATVTPFPEKRMIWSNIDLDLKDWKELREEYPDYTEEQLTDIMYDTNNGYLDDERSNLDIQCNSEIVAIADIGRWNGRFAGYGIIKSGNVADCLYSPHDYAQWYVDRDGEFRSTQIHHDGSNYYYYRSFKDGVEDYERDDLLADIYDGKATQEQIDRLTDKLGPTIGKVYGWEFPTDKAARVSSRDAR